MAVPLRWQGHDEFDHHLPQRERRGRIWSFIFRASTVVGIVALLALTYNIVNETAGLVAVENKVDPESLAVAGYPLEDLPKEHLIGVLRNNVSEARFRTIDRRTPFEQMSRDDVYDLVRREVVQSDVLETFTLFDTLFHRDEIEARVAEELMPDHPDVRIEFRVWLTTDFVTDPQNATPEIAGVRTAILGSLWVIAITIVFSFPIGVGAAVYLEEYAEENRINTIIQTNINNLAGVPSIIYGMLGLAIFVRLLGAITSGALFDPGGDVSQNGRTVLSAGLTLGLLILPIVIINAQEAIRAVPSSLRQASYGLGATQWQTIWHHVLPSALPGILTGTILSVSRAIGETAPLVVIGASTFITADPEGPFSKFTVLPIQIYQWTARPQDEFRSIAAAAIIVLLALLLSLNATAVLLRNRYSRRM